MARIIPLHGEEHEEIQRLLPWYVTAQLDPGERARVETHLAACAECRAEVRSEQALRSDISTMPAQVERDWARLRDRIGAAQPAPAGRRGARPARRRPPSWVGWAIAAQVLLVVLLGAQVASRQRPAEYRTLAASPAAGARIIVTFRPDSREQDLRATLNGVRARLVDGPTSTNAYVLQVPAADRETALARLRAQPAVVLAEALDANEPR